MVNGSKIGWCPGERLWFKDFMYMFSFTLDITVGLPPGISH